MAFIPGDGVVELAVEWVCGDVHSFNIFHTVADAGGPVSNADLLTCASDLYSALNTTIEPLLVSDIGILSVKATDLTSQTAGTHLFAAPGNGGAGAPPQVPPGSAIDISWVTGSRGRSFRGRSFFMGLPRLKADDDGRIDGTVHSSLQTAAQSLITDMRAAPHAIGLVVASRQSNGLPRGAIVTTQVDGANVRLFLKSQRRRNLKG